MTSTTPTIDDTKTMPDNEQRLPTESASLLWILGVAWFLPMAAATPAMAVEDSLTVGSIPLAVPGDTVQVPIYVRDVSGTPLGGDAGAGRTIQDLSVVVQVLPPAAVISVTFQRAGVLASPTPVFAQLIDSGNEHGAIIAFSESGDPIVFTVDLSAPGDLVAQLAVEIAPGFDQGTISLELVEAKTALGNQTGSLVEQPANGRLTLLDGSIYVDSSGIFVDGFESGDVLAWSASQP